MFSSLGLITSRAQHAVAVLGKGGHRLGSELQGTRLGRSAPVRLIVRVIKEMGEDDATHMAASVSYYTVLSLFPLILALTSITGWVVRYVGRRSSE